MSANTSDGNVVPAEAEGQRSPPEEQQEKGKKTSSKKYANQWKMLARFFRKGGEVGKEESGSNSTMRFNPFHLFSQKLLDFENGPVGTNLFYRVIQFQHQQNPKKKKKGGNLTITQKAEEQTSTTLSSVVLSNSCGKDEKENLNFAGKKEEEERVQAILRVRSENNTTVSDIRVAHQDGVDNTGNFHWPAEEVLAHLLLTQSLPYWKQWIPTSKEGKCKEEREIGVHQEEQLNTKSTVTILELGAGTGLAGFMLAAKLNQLEEIVREQRKTENGLEQEGKKEKVEGEKDKRFQIILTDGNSSVVENLQENINRRNVQPKCKIQSDVDNHNKHDNNVQKEEKEESANHQPLQPTGVVSLAAMQLRWQEIPQEISSGALKVDYIIGADCLFFESFHQDLAKLLLTCFKVQPELLVMLVAPSRGSSLHRFVEIFQKSAKGFFGEQKEEEDAEKNTTPKESSFVISVQKDYDEHMSAMDVKLRQKCEEKGAEVEQCEYLPDRHYPLLVLIRRT